MMKSESIKELASALAKFNGKVSGISKDANNPQFRSKYVTLDHLIKETRPILQEFGLSVLQFPLSSDTRGVGVQTMILHESGEYLESDPLYMTPMKLVKGGNYEEAKDAQGAGSTISYLRRYSYQAVLNLATGEDDDGNKASGRDDNNNSNNNNNNYNSNNNSNNNNTGSPQGLTDKQISRLWGIAKSKNVANEIVFKMLKSYGLSDAKLLTKEQYNDICNRLETDSYPSTTEQMDSIKTLMTLKNVNKDGMKDIVRKLFGGAKSAQDLNYTEALQVINNLMALADYKTA